MLPLMFCQAESLETIDLFMKSKSEKESRWAMQEVEDVQGGGGSAFSPLHAGMYNRWWRYICTEAAGVLLVLDCQVVLDLVSLKSRRQVVGIGSTFVSRRYTYICIHEQLFPGLSHSVQVTRFRTVAALRRVPPPNHRSSLSARTRTLARLSRLSSNQLAFHPIANGSGGGRRRRTGGSVDRRPAAREGVRVRGPSERRPRPRDQWYRGGGGGEDGALKSREPLLSLSVRGGGARPSARPQDRGGGRPAAGRGRGGVDWGRP